MTFLDDTLITNLFLNFVLIYGTFGYRHRCDSLLRVFYWQSIIS